MKTVLYVIIVIALIGGGIFAWFYFSKTGVQAGPNTSSLPSASLSPSLSPLPPSYTIADTFPKTETISIGTDNGTVEVKNFYKTFVDTEEGSVIMIENENYEVFYDRGTSRFYIYLITPLASQSQAETDLLNILGIGQQDACKLGVRVIRANQPDEGALSFCVGR